MHAPEWPGTHMNIIVSNSSIMLHIHSIVASWVDRPCADSCLYAVSIRDRPFQQSDMIRAFVLCESSPVCTLSLRRYASMAYSSVWVVLQWDGVAPPETEHWIREWLILSIIQSCIMGRWLSLELSVLASELSPLSFLTMVALACMVLRTCVAYSDDMPIPSRVGMASYMP